MRNQSKNIPAMLLGANIIIQSGRANSQQTQPAHLTHLVLPLADKHDDVQTVN